MDLLDDNEIKATFFLLGRSIAGRERIVKQIEDRGHEICSHGYDHLHYWKVHPFRALADIKRGWRAIDAALGQERKKYPFRPPYGKLNFVCLLYLLIRRIPIIFWSLDFRDTWNLHSYNQGRITSTIKNGGAVTLAHLHDRSDIRQENMVIEAVQTVLSEARKAELKVLTVSELLLEENI